MKEVCRDCGHAKPYSEKYCNCTKYGCPIRYGRTYCVSYNGGGKNDAKEAGISEFLRRKEQIQQAEDNDRWINVRQQARSDEILHVEILGTDRRDSRFEDTDCL